MAHIAKMLTGRTPALVKIASMNQAIRFSSGEYGNGVLAEI